MHAGANDSYNLDKGRGRETSRWSPSSFTMKSRSGTPVGKWSASQYLIQMGTSKERHVRPDTCVSRLQGQQLDLVESLRSEGYVHLYPLLEELLTTFLAVRINVESACIQPAKRFTGGKQ